MATILVAEDDEAVREMLCRALRGDGHTVIDAGDGQVALQEAARHDIAVLVSDISMPETDGVTLAETLLGSKPGLCVILMSAIADEISRAQGLAGNNVRVLNKPVSLEKVREEVASLLNA